MAANRRKARYASLPAEGETELAAKCRKAMATKAEVVVEVFLTKGRDHRWTATRIWPGWSVRSLRRIQGICIQRLVPVDGSHWETASWRTRAEAEAKLPTILGHPVIIHSVLRLV